MVPLTEGYRYQALTSTNGGVAQRWVLIYSAPRQPQAHRTIDKQCRKHSDQEVKAWQKLCGTTVACEADARQALATFAQDLQATFLATSTVRATPRYGKRGRPRQGVRPDQVVYQIEGALASSLAARQARVDQHSCFILATNERDAHQLPPPELLHGYKIKRRPNAGFASSKPPAFWLHRFTSKSPSASWRCSWC